LLLLGRLGLRAGEVAALEMEHIDWRAGEIEVHGKGNRHERLPLPVEVGEAVAAYLQRGRPTSASRSVFLGAVAPHLPLTQAGVSGIVRTACRRVGLPIGSAHQLRHGVARQVLRQGGTLEEVGQLLRQRHSGTTSIYARVDRDALAKLALPWPGTAS
jgi:site-specific recombinase XerD